MILDHLDESPSATVRRHAPTFRKVRQARQAAVEKLSDAPPAKLEPLVAQHELSDDDAPSSAKKLASAAREAGWRVAVVATRSASGVDVVSVRARLSDDACVGLWRDGRFSDGVVGVPSWPRPANAGELAAYLRCRPRGWFRREQLHMLGPARPKKRPVDSPPMDTVE
jgi:hypothetical protein